jgi:hypothetical protein
VFTESAEASPDVRFKQAKSKAGDNLIGTMRVVPLCPVVEREMGGVGAKRRVGETAKRRVGDGAVGRKTRRVEDTIALSANPRRFRRLAASGTRRVPPPLRFGAAWSMICGLTELGRDVGLAKSGSRPTGHGVLRICRPFAHSPFRRFAVSPPPLTE